MSTDGSTNNSLASDRRSHVMVGELPGDFLRINGTAQQQQSYSDERVAQILQAQQQAGFMPLPVNVKGRLNISIVQARLQKNYGLTRMDPYCRIRVGHAVFETPAAYNGGKNPQWGKDMQCFLQNGVDNMYVEIFDEKTFTNDDRVAWAHVSIPPACMNGETVDEWHNLSGKQGDGKEGTINLVLTFTPMEELSQAPAVMPQMMYPNMQPYPGMMMMQTPGVAYPPQMQMPPGQPQVPEYTEEDFKQVKDMFPNLEDDIIRSVFAANSGHKENTIGSLLQMSAD